MIPRYTHPGDGPHLERQRRYETWLEVELAAAEVMAEAGIVPADAARDLRAPRGASTSRASTRSRRRRSTT